MFQSLFFLLTFCVLLVVSVAAETVVIDFRAGTTALGVFFQGNQEDKELDLEADSFNGMIEPYGHNTQYISTSEGFTVRTVDFKHRVKVIVWKNEDPATSDDRTYKITLKNLSLDDAIELKLSKKGGYQWI
jgi:hypothetical protein